MHTFLLRLSLLLGAFLTPMLTTSLSKEQLNAFCNMIPYPKRLGDPDEFAQLVLSIIENPMLNGSVIRLDAALRAM